MKYFDSSFVKLVLLFAAVLLASCDRGGDGVPVVDPDFVETDDPNRFLQFLNPQTGLPAGKYRIVAGTQSLGAAGSFTITVTRDDGAAQTFTGSWTASGGTDTDDLSPGAANPSFEYIMPYSGGARFSITSSVPTCLYLLDAGDTVLVGKRDIGGPDEDLCTHPATIDMPKSKINLEANAKAYYHAIDPPVDENGVIDLVNGKGTRTTLKDWMDANGFGQPCPVSIPDCEHHVIFRDTKDLGYGRDMRARKNEDGSFAVFVRNFRVDAVPGLQYSTLNLQAAIANNTDPSMLSNIQWHFGSNAIEFSAYPYGVDEPRDGEIPAFSTNDGNAPFFTKYYTFKPDDVHDPNTTERRLDLVNLDGRGDISMPGPCIACHGGTSRPLLPNGDFPAPIPGGVPGDTQAQMQVIEVSTVTFSNVPGWTCQDIIAGVHFINQGVLDTYAKVKDQYGGVSGYWQPEFAAELIKGWYGDTASAEDPDDYEIDPKPDDINYDPVAACNYLTKDFYDYVPQGWRPNPDTGTPPAGADNLFREVIAPNCMVCHSRRGVNLGANTGIGVMQDIDFGSYEKFISHAEQIERFIYHKGVMPLGLLNFDAFWDNSNIGGSGLGRAELLASHLPGFSSFNADGSVRRPGGPVAVAAAPRNSNVPVIISAEGSSFASTYQWSILASPVNSTPTLTNTGSARAVFDTDQNGEYQLQLTAGNGTQTNTVTFNISVSSALPRPQDLRFETSMNASENIKNVLQANPVGTACVSCHAPQGSPGTPIEGVPVFYVDNNDQPENRDLYLEVLHRINFKEPVESPLLRKPSGYHHYGSQPGGFDLDGGNRSNYDLFLNWILQGAPR